VRWLGIFFLAFSAALPARAAEPAPCSRFVPDRPGATKAHTVVGAGCFHLEGATNVTRLREATNLSFPLFARFGIGDIFELRISNALIGIGIPDDTSVDVTSTPLGLEGKIMAIEATGPAPGLGLLFGAWAPLGDRFFHEIDPQMKLLFDWDFVEHWRVSLNVGLSAPPAEVDVRFARFGGAFVLSWRPIDWLRIHVDTEGGIGLRREEPWAQRLGAGLAFGVADNAQIDASTSLEMTPDEKKPVIYPIVAELGFAWRL
jgi:outer membrane putative beta-barrel porin/alpha-amylase